MAELMIERNPNLPPFVDALVDDFIETLGHSITSSDGYGGLSFQGKERLKTKLKAIIVVATEANNG